MIGNPVVCVVWSVNYRYQSGKDVNGNPKITEGAALVVTGDVTGADLVANTEFAVLGTKPPPNHELTLLHVHRVGSAKGCAIPASEHPAKVPFTSSWLIQERERLEQELDAAQSLIAQLRAERPQQQ